MGMAAAAAATVGSAAVDGGRAALRPAVEVVGTAAAGIVAVGTGVADAAAAGKTSAGTAAADAAMVGAAVAALALAGIAVMGAAVGVAVADKAP